MANREYTDITLVLDRSSSMRDCKEGTVDGFNKYLDDRKLEGGKCLVSLYLFNHQYTPKYSGLSVFDAPRLDSLSCPYQPDGWTALHGAVGRAIDETGKRLADMPEHERPHQVLFVIVTDGEENWSKREGWSNKYDGFRVRNMVQHQKDKYNWQFVFLGANQDAVLQAQEIGIPSTWTSNYNADNVFGARKAFETVSRGTSAYRTSGLQQCNTMLAGAKHVDDAISDAEIAKVYNMNVPVKDAQKVLTAAP